MSSLYQVVTFKNALDTLPTIITKTSVSDSFLKSYIETHAGYMYGLSLDSEGLWSELLSGFIVEGRHYQIQTNVEFVE